MYTTVLLSSLFLLHVTCTPQLYGHHGRRVCLGDARSPRVPYSTESFLQPLHKPYITMCQNQRMCSTYKTIYRVSYRQVSKAVAHVHMYSDCCPGWKRMHSHNCNQAVCEQSCANGGSCLRPNQCVCSKGWTGRYCQTDVDECKETRGCSQKCVNTPGGYQCVCREGFNLNEDGMTCSRIPTPSLPPAAPPTGDHLSSRADAGLKLVENVTEEVKMLKNKVDLLEQKLEMVLAPFTTLFPVNGVGGVGDSNGFLSDRTNFLSHSLQQLDRIDSLSEQVGFLEERIGACACHEN